MIEAERLIAGEQLKAAPRVLVVSHIRPDGDAVGSLLGIGLALQAAGKDVQMVLADGTPSTFRHLEGSNQIRRRPEGEPGYIIVVDCSDLKRTGGSLNGYPLPDLNIDHHITNENFARLNIVDTQAVATAEVLVECIRAWGLPLTQPVAAALLTGLVTDTLGFRTSNITPKALRMAADLMEKGVDLHELYRMALIERSYAATRYWGAGLNRIQREGRIVWTVLTQADRKEIGYPGRDDADLITILSGIEDADVVVVFIEQPDGRIKISWRAQPGFDVSRVALEFGGGGHPAAAGAEVEGSLAEVCQRVLESTRLALDNNVQVETER